MLSDFVDSSLDRRQAGAPERAIALALSAIVLFSAPMASAEDDEAGPQQYEVVGEPIDDPGPQPTDPNYGTTTESGGVTPPPTYTPTTTAPGYGDPNAAQATTPPPPPPTAFVTGFGGGVFGSYAPVGNFANFDSATGFVGDLNAMAGLGGYIAGLGRWVGGGAQLRASWFLDLDPDSSWSIIDVSGMFRFRWHHGIFEVYGDVTGGFSIQRINTGGVVENNTDGGVNFGIAPGFRVFATDTLSFYVELGGIWRAMFGDALYAIGMRQFVIEFGVGFGS